MIEYSMNDIVVNEDKHFVFDFDRLNEDIHGWFCMVLKVEDLYLMHGVACIDSHMDKGLCFYSNSKLKDRFFEYDPNSSGLRSCAIVEFEAFSKQTITLENSPNTKVILNNYLTTVVEKKFDKWTTKIHVGDLIWFRTRYYANDKCDRVIDVTSVGFVTRYDETTLTITYRDIDNTVSPEHVSVKTIDLYPNRLRMFDWYVIDENNKKEVTK